MTTCDICRETFPLLAQDTRCGRCSQRRPGMCAPELKALNDKPQCCGCGLCSRGIRHPMCPKCVSYYRAADSVPRSLLSISGVAALISTSTGDNIPGESQADSGDEVTELTDDVIHEAQKHKAGASTYRLGNPKPGAQGTKAALKQLNKKKSVVADRKAKKEENETAKTGVRITGQIWVASRFSAKMNALVPCKCDKAFALDATTQSAFDTILLELSKVFQRHYPKAERLNWSNVTIYSHESQTGYSALEGFGNDKLISDLLAEFQSLKWGSKKNLEERKLAVRFMIYKEDVLPDDEDFDEVDELQSGWSSLRASKSSSTASKTIWLGSKNMASTSLASKRKREGSSSAAVLSKSRTAGSLAKVFRPEESPASSSEPATRLRPPVPVPDWSYQGPSHSGDTSLTAKQVLSSAHAYQYQRERERASVNSNVRRSAYRPPKPRKAWTRHPVTLQEFVFGKQTVSCSPGGGAVVFTPSDKECVIEIPHPSEWEDNVSIGFVGEGATKRGIYARYEGTEYVITQLKDAHATREDNESILKSEIELLCQGDWFKKQFDDEAHEYGINIPAFNFNFRDSFIGELKPSITSGSRPLPLSHFLATRLLPCGPVDAPIRKFTGNEQIGRPDDTMTELIHSFAHFTYLCSGGSLVFCDLQGMVDKDGHMSLIDPQIHTVSERQNRHAYWDGGPEMIEAFLRQHGEGCRSNHYCRKLQQCGARPFELSSASSVHSPPRKRAMKEYQGANSGNKKPIDFVLNEV